MRYSMIPQAQMGLYIGRSPPHAANVSSILNPQTGCISLQFHVIYDDDFTTDPFLCTATGPPPQGPAHLFPPIFGFGRKHYLLRMV
jgi:hypothetical protein